MLLAPAAGILAAIPQAALTAGVALKTLGLAFDGVGKAIEGNKKAYDQLTPAQKEFVDVVRNALYPLLNGLKQIAAEALLPQLVDSIKTLLDSDLGGVVGGGIQAFADAIGDAAQAWAGFLSNTEVVGRISQMLAFGAQQLGIWNDTLINIFDIFLTLGTAFQPLSQFIDESVNRFTKWASEGLKAAEASGELARANEVIIRSIRLLFGLVAALGDVFEALYEVLNPLGQQLVPALTEALHGLADWLRANADTIRGVLLGAFQALVGTIQTLWPLIQDEQGHRPRRRCGVADAPSRS